jgi:hypothetical protein
MPPAVEKPKAPQKAPPDAQPKKPPSYLPAPIEEVNSSIAEAWEQLGKFQQLKIQKATLLKLANMQEMPLIGIDVIPTQQGLRLYINGEGAKFNRERYLHQNGRRMVERRVEPVPYDQCPFADPGRDKAQGRVYFKITTIVEDVDQKEKIVSAVAAGTIKASEVGELLKNLKVVAEYVTWSAFSNQSEKFADNRQPDAILKKGITQSHRRADLEISSQCVIPEDEETIDAKFSIKAEAVLDAAKGEAAMPSLTLVPDKTTKIELPAPPAKVDGEKPGSEGEGDVMALVGQLNNIFDTAQVKKVDRIKWMTENGYPTKKAEMTPAILAKAIAKANEQFIKKAAPVEPAAPAAAPAQEDPEKAKILAKIFAQAKPEKAGFEDPDAIRAWVKGAYGKGLSEMTAQETSEVEKRVTRFTDLIAKHQKWGFSSPLELIQYAQDTKPIHAMTDEEIKKLEDNFDEMVT